MEDEEYFPISMVNINKFSSYLEQGMNLTGLTHLKSMINPENAVYADRSYPYT